MSRFPATVGHRRSTDIFSSMVDVRLTPIADGRLQIIDRSRLHEGESRMSDWFVQVIEEI